MSRYPNPDQIITIRILEDGSLIDKDFGYSIRKLKKRELYEIKITLGKTPDGRQRRISFYGKNPNIAKGKAKVYLQEQYGYNEPPKSYTIESWGTEFLNIYNASLSHKTKESYKSYLNNYLIPSFGQKELYTITKYDAQNFADKLRQEKNKCTVHKNNDNPPTIGNKTIKNIFAFLIRLLKTAMDRDLVHSVVATMTMIDKPIKKVAKAIPDNLLVHFFRAIHRSRFLSFYLFLLFSGTRLSEAIALTKSEIEADEIYIMHQLQSFDPADINHEDIVVCTELVKRKGAVHPKVFALVKTKSKRERHVHMSPVLKKYIEDQIAFSDNVSIDFPNPHGFIFIYENGSFYRKSTVEKDFRRRLREYSQQTGVSFDGITLHSLRHSFVSLLFGVHADEQAVSEQVGHSNVNVTNSIYRHLSEAAKNDFIEKKDHLDIWMDEMFIVALNNPENY